MRAEFAARLQIGHLLLGPGHPPVVVAEIGVNHNGSFEIASAMCAAAAGLGANAVKFQTFKAESVAAERAPKADYQLETTDPTQSQREMLRSLELSANDHRRLMAQCAKQGVLFLSTPYDHESVDLLAELGLAAFKLSSAEITNHPLLAYAASKAKPLIVSTGMSSLAEVEAAVEVIRAAGCEQLALLHCLSEYPADPAQANLRAMQTLAAHFGVPVGFSDHTPGIEVALAAVALGACLIEKHFTLDKSMPGPDQRASAEPSELQALVSGVRLVAQALGDGVKQPSPTEGANRKVVRRSLAARKTLETGSVLTPESLIAIRPATGIPPTRLGEVVGRTLRTSLAAGELLSWELLA
jgi:N-acetylneuraminate synthase